MNRRASAIPRAKAIARRFGRVGALVTVVALAFSVPGRAQQGHGPRYRLVDDPAVESGVDRERASPFNIAGLGDYARTGVITTGTNRFCYGNTGVFEPYFDLGCTDIDQYNTAQGTVPMFFEISYAWGAPPSDMPEVIPKDKVVGGGWTMLHNNYILTGITNIRASDRSGAALLAFGITSTTDGSCRDFSAPRNGGMSAGIQLLPSNVCKETWPPAGWQGDKPIPKEGFIKARADGYLGDDDPFAFWRVPTSPEYRKEAFLGNFQTFAEISDHTLDILSSGTYGYNEIIPGYTGKATARGWPLGLTMSLNGFYFNLPTVNNAYFHQLVIVNESEKVYGKPIDYDSIYWGFMADPLISPQQVAIYTDTRRSAWVFRLPSSNCLGRPVPPGSVCSNIGFARGGGGIVWLKSPIGDMRYKLFSNRASEFYNPRHPRAGDTITFNHQHMCGFGDCWAITINRSARSAFGMWSSTEANVLDGRSPADLSERALWRTFRSENWPGTPADVARFNRYVPGVSDRAPIWDWNHDGVPDTIYADNCGRRGCVVLWSDTLPSGYVNSYGNISVLGVGPFSLKAGDTTAVVFALITAPDSVSFEGLVDNVIAFYQEFYLGPEAPTPVRIVSADVTAGSVRDNAVRLFIDDTAEEFEDPFLKSFLEKLVSAGPTAELGKLRVLNPWIVDSLRARVSDNVAALHVFKSCDGGETFTDDADCYGDPVPASDPTAKFGPFGWLPWRTLEPDREGQFPNIITDRDVRPGLTMLYSIVAESRGAKWRVLVDEGAGAVPTDASGNPVCVPSRCGPKEFEIAPKLMNPLSRSSGDPNVTAVYIPASRMAGEKDATVDLKLTKGFATVPFEVVFSGRQVVGGVYRAVFGDQVVVTSREGLTTVAVQDLERVARPDGTADTAVIGEQIFQTRTEVTLGTGAKTVAPGQWVFDKLALVLLNPAREPLFVSASLAGGTATPGAFMGRPDFPFFVINADNTVVGTFQEQLYKGPRGEAVAPAVQPTMRWLNRLATSVAGRYGRYQIKWSDEGYGPRSPFSLTAGNLQGQMDESMASRRNVSTSRADAVARAALQAAGVAVDGELKAYKLPFTVQNLTYGNPVDVVVTSHQSTVLLGLLADTTRVRVPADAWVPGDRIALLETFQTDSTVLIGGQRAVVLDAGGRPIKVTRTVVTWTGFIGCESPRASCNATRGAVDPRTGASGYVAVQPDMGLEFHYYSPFTAETEYTFTVTPAVLAKDVPPAERDLSRVAVVPNPYAFFQSTERGQPHLKFANLPPEGTIRIYTVSGQFVQEIRYDADDLVGAGTSGDLEWNLQTRERTEISYGLYIWVLTTPDGRKAMGKFVILR